MGFVGLNASAGRGSSIVICVRPTPEKSRSYLPLVRSFTVAGVEFEGNPDGSAAYLTFKGSPDCLGALKTTQEIVWSVDRHNLLQPPSERYHVRIGIATGLDGTQTAGFASTLAKAARPEQVLIDSVCAGLGIPDFMLKAEDPVAGFRPVYSLRLQRLLKAAPADFARNGLVALYPDREMLRHDLTPARLLYMAAPGSEMLIAGRTLISWTRLADELGFQARQKKLTYRFLVSSLASCSILGEDELKEIKRDYTLAKHAFERMVSDIPAAVEVKETDQAVIDGVTCLQVLLPGVTDEQQRTLIVLQDVNAAPGSGKPTLVFACHNTSPDCACMAHGLYKRTRLRIERASVPEPTEPATMPLFVREEGLKGRNNNPSRYVRRMSAVFESAIQEDSSIAPAPFCVQVQVSDVCSTHCKMCEQYIEQLARAKARPSGGGTDYGHGLSREQWKEVFSQLGRFGVRATVFSGGEPLMRMNIHKLARDAKEAGLSVGLLTNGSMDWDAPVRELVLPELAERISWASVSVDGIADVDRRIRNPTLDEKERIARIAEFASAVLTNRENEPGRLSASVTLQKWNINSDLRRLCEFIHEELKIPVVNFKLATGARGAIGSLPDYLLDLADLDQLQRFLWESRLPDEEGNNLSYLRRCFARGVFDEKSAVDGAPLRAFYSSNNMRCFTPYTFALIDQDGSVYPCCHLFRDNHGHSAPGKSLRRRHYLGSVVSKDESGKVLTFAEIWRGRTYAKKRNALVSIDPNAADYAPCGECTRYCQHNISMNRLFEKYRSDPDAFGRMPEDDGPVWF